MTGVDEDVVVENERLLRNYKTLQEKFPDHELLKLATVTDDGITLVDDIVVQCVGKKPNHDHPLLLAKSYYNAAMEVAINGEAYRLPPEITWHDMKPHLNFKMDGQ